MVVLAVVLVFRLNSSRALPTQSVATTTPSQTILEENIKNIVKKFDYLEIVGGCGPHSEGVCLDVHSAPSLDSKVVMQLRKGVVLKVSEKVVDDTGIKWYKVTFDWLRYPERVLGDWYIQEDLVRIFSDVGEESIVYKTIVDNGQHIVIDLSKQKLYAYDGDELFMETPISTGYELTPTLVGTFSVYIKSPSRYMQGPQPGMDDYYDLPGVPWVMYFTSHGAAIHGAYWHDDFGNTHSHGCINLPPEVARKLYEWAELGTKITVEN